VTTEASSEEGTESGGALRDKLEATIADNRALREALSTEVVSGFKYVKPEDLADVAPGDLRTRATEIEEQRAAERREVLQAELSARGLDDAAIEEILAGSGQAAPTQQDLKPKTRLDPNVGAPPARPKPGDGDGLSGPSRIRAALG
jgi:anti-sigma factor ChrR (cupin superfamily)